MIKDYLLIFLSLFICLVFLMGCLSRKTSQKKIEQLKANVVSLQAAKLEKEKILRVLIHDTSNSLFVSLYKLKKINIESYAQGVLVEKILKSLTALKDILTYVKEIECVTSGNRFNSVDKIILNDCLVDMQETFLDGYRSKGVELIIQSELHELASIHFNKTLFVHCVVSNLLSNALKFSHPGTQVLIKAYQVSPESLSIDVVDQGIGMPKESLENLFEIESSLTRLGTSGERGFGFGMPIAKAYTKMFGGTITAKSSPGLGTTITLNLPMKAS